MHDRGPNAAECGAGQHLMGECGCGRVETRLCGMRENGVLTQCELRLPSVSQILTAFSRPWLVGRGGPELGSVGLGRSTHVV